ncbi:MAG TPA: carboxypeptidase regulatory-like domain-containing protein [Acidobacteriaceae bacterium]|nr:carboxypeptidase regulatory-like domain-containing protein [Acidobacteriaceae bacterium]
MHRTSTRLMRAAAMVCAALALAATAAWAQTITGSIRGTVTDPSGAVIAGASVAATNVATGVTTTSHTSKQGEYNIQFLPIGNYTVTVTASGFAKSTIAAFALEIDQIAKVDAKLQVGDANTTVNVSSETSPLLQTQDATLGTTINSNTLSTLPMNALNYQFATLFVPGAVDVTLSSMGGADGNERATDWYGTPSFNGNRGQTNNYVLDGVEMNETMNNLSAYNPAPDAISEMRVITGNANAEYGNVNGGEVLVITKGGTNHFHGSVYDYFQDNYMSANSWANNYSSVKLQPYTQDQYGATIGGRILRDKLFFFGDYLGFRYHTGGVAKATVATAKMRTGDFSEVYGSEYGGFQLWNNQNGAGFANATMYANNQIPIVNPVAKYLFAHPEVYPLPNTTPIYADLDNYSGFSKGQTHNNQGDVRIDYKATDRDAIMGRYTYGNATDFYALAVLPTTFPPTNTYPFQSFVANWVHTFSPAWINEFRAGVARTIWLQGIPNDLTGDFGMSGNAKVGIPFPNQPFPGFSEMNFSTFESNVGTAAGINEFHENNFYYGDDLTWQHGTHTTRFGVQILRYQQNSWYAGNAGAMGQFGYDGQYTANGNTGSQGYGFADFVLDQADGATVGGVAGPNGQRQYRNAWYAQDDWRIRPNLTLNLGLRYAYDQPIYEVNNKESSFDLATPDAGLGGILLAGKNGNSRSLYNPFHLEFMPRFGFEYQPYHKLVVRGGYGITDDLEGTGANLRMTQNAPFFHTFSYAPTPPTSTNNGQGPMPVENGFNLSSSANTISTFNFNVWQTDLKPALIQQFNLAVQYILTPTITAQVGYVGELGQHLIVPAQLDQYSSTATGYIADGDCSGTIAPAAPYCSIVGNDGNLFYTESNAYSNYNAMQAFIRRQSANGSYTINYTWSKAMTNNAGFYGVAGVAESSSFFQNVYDPHGDYGPAGDDTRNSVTANGVYHLPFGRGHKFGNSWNRPMDEILGGWQLSGDAVLYSGFPLTMGSYEDYYVNSFAAHSIHFRPMKIAHRSIQNWFGTDPSAQPCVTIDNSGNTVDDGTCAYGIESENGFGNSQNGSERAPGFRQVDLSAFKMFTIREGQVLELRGDAFNALNLASYAPPNAQLESYPSPSFGRITGTNSSQRVMQVSMKYRF